MTNNRRERSLSGSALLVLVLLAPSARAWAANGDLVHETFFATPCPVSSFPVGSIGVGIAFDGKAIWYSCAGTGAAPDLFKADAMTGATLASYNVAGGLGALAWDGKRKMIWAGWGAGSGNTGDVRLIDPNTGTGTVVFNAAEAAIDDLDDGLAYDARDDSLLISADTSTTIYHYATAGGTFLDSFTWAGDSCYNSGVAIGGDLLFQGSDGCDHVWVVQRSDLSPAFDFPTGADGVRDEDLECDSVTFSPRTVMWSIEAYEPRRAIAFEIPAGSCATGGGVDSDGDGLLDEWETNGITIDPDGDGPIAPQFIDLPAMGADPMKPDIFLQVDWMEDASHSHKLDPQAIKKIVAAFAAAPYTSPTGSTGINLHVDEGPASILDFTTNATWGSLSKARSLTHVDNLGTGSPSSYDWTAFQALKDASGGFTESGRTPIFHYVVSAHNYDSTTSSGISRDIVASDLIVSLGSFTNNVGSVAEQAGTLMHELGHNLGLHHGGNEDANYKPNYLSIMSYAFQMQGVIKGGVGGILDYSRSGLASLDKGHLDETTGLGSSAAGYGTRSFCAGMGFVPVANANGPIDWNCDGVATGTNVSADVNNAGSATGTLTGFDDWANLTLRGGAIGLAGVVPTLPTTTPADLLTVEVAKQVIPLPEDGGFIPPDKASSKCEGRAAQSVAKLAAAIVKCHSQAAHVALKKKAAEDESCETAAKKKFDAATKKLKGCPACLATGMASMRNAVESAVDDTTATVFCVGSTPFGGDDGGFVPPDKGTLKCQDRVSDNVGRLAAAVVRCHVKAAESGLKGKTFDEEACETAAKSKFEGANHKAKGCPACLVAAQSGLGDQIETLIDANNGNVYCAGTKAWP